MKESTKPKIDLAEITKRAKHIISYFQYEMGVQDIDLRFPYKLPLADCEQIAAALEALPKLVEALQNMNGCYNTPIQKRKANEQQLEAINFASEALAPFTTKTPQQ